VAAVSNKKEKEIESLCAVKTSTYSGIKKETRK